MRQPLLRVLLTLGAIAVVGLLMDDLAPGPLGLAQEHAVAYRKARPFPHAVFDGVFPPPLLDQVPSEWSTEEAIDWKIYASPSEFKARVRGCAAPRPRPRAFLNGLAGHVPVLSVVGA